MGDFKVTFTRILLAIGISNHQWLLVLLSINQGYYTKIQVETRKGKIRVKRERAKDKNQGKEGKQIIQNWHKLKQPLVRTANSLQNHVCWPLASPWQGSQSPGEGAQTLGRGAARFFSNSCGTIMLETK